MIRSVKSGSGNARTLWFEHRDASLNWLALGLLLAAWNACNNDVPPTPQRPAALRSHAFVSVRAAQRSRETFFRKGHKSVNEL